MLDRTLTEKILAGLGLGETPAPDLKGLERLYHAWCRRVPFDNILKRIHLAEGLAGPLPGDRPEDFFRSWLEHGTGGTCWAGNGALCELLTSLGFAAQRGIATMMVAPDIPPNHGTVSVRLDARTWIVDASILHSEPLALLDEDTSIDTPAWSVTLRRENDRRILRWKPFFADHLDCRIESLTGTTADFSTYHEATRGWGPFNYSVSVRTIRDDRMIGMAFGECGEVDAQGRRRVTAFEADGRTRFLIEEIGISEEMAVRCPADETMPPPPR